MAHRRLHVGEAGGMGIAPEAVMQFLRGAWSRPNVLCLSRFYEWQFLQCPDHPGLDRCLVVADGGGGVHGFVGINARPFLRRGQRQRGAELTTWVVSQQIRGAAYTRDMVVYLLQQYDAVVGMSLSPMAVPVLTRMGWRYVRWMPRFVRVFNVARLEGVAEIAPLGRKLMRRFAELPSLPYKSEPISFEEAGQSAAALHGDFCCFSRDATHLKWRYEEHPNFDYRAHRVSSNGSSAVVILRIDEKPELKIAHVIDVFGSLEALPAVVRFLEDTCKAEQVDVAELFCTTSRVSHVFWHYGWFSAIDDPWVQVPHLLYPIELRTPPTSSLILWARDDLCSLLDLSRLYVTRGDGDLDRPTPAYFEEKGIRP